MTCKERAGRSADTPAGMHHGWVNPRETRCLQDQVTATSLGGQGLPSPGLQANQASLGKLQMRKQSRLVGGWLRHTGALLFPLVSSQPTYSLFPSWGPHRCLSAPLPAAPPWGAWGSPADTHVNSSLLQCPAAHPWASRPISGAISCSWRPLLWDSHPPAIRRWQVRRWYRCLNTLGARDPGGTGGSPRT